MPLIIAPNNISLIIIKILADARTKKHLESLGITINSSITILDKSGGNVICIVKEGRLALDSSIATRILVN